MSDFKEISRSAIFSLNYLFPVIVLPLIMIISLLIVMNQDEISFNEVISSLRENINFNNPFIMLLNLISISLDLWRPYLIWSSENELMKNSAKSTIYMIVCWLATTILFGIEFTFYLLIPTSGYILLALIMLLSIVVCLLMYKHLNKNTIFNKI